jgi:hypothetical protein
MMAATTKAAAANAAIARFGHSLRTMGILGSQALCPHIAGKSADIKTT